MTRIPPTGWHVEIDNPNTGHTFSPSVVGEPERRPRANGYPKIEIPLARNEKWLNSAFESAPLRVWFDGDRQPIDEVEAVKLTEGQTIIKGRGGLELREQVKAEYDAKAVDEAARELISNNTSYTANVDQPPNATETNKTVQTVQTNSEWTNRRIDSPSTSPLIVRSNDSHGDGDVFTCAQTGFFFEAENQDSGFGGGDVSDSEASDGTGVTMFDTSHSLSYDFTPEYTIPESELGVAFRFITTDSTDEPGFRISIDGNTVVDVSNTNWWGSTLDNVAWRDVSDVSIGDLAGNTSHTVQWEVITDSGNNIILDAVYVYDKRYHDFADWSDSVGGSGYLSLPGEYPVAQGVSQEFEDAETVKRVTGGRVENLNANAQDRHFEVALSNDRGSSYSTSTSSPFETDFGSPGTTLRLRLTLSATTDTRVTASPKAAFKPHKIDSYRLQADLDNLPLLVDQKFNGQLINVLNEIAGDEFVWEARRDGSSYSIEFTQPNLRTVNRDDLPVSSYTVTKTTAERIQKAVVFGGKQPLQDERFAANHGTAVNLSKRTLIPASETVRNPSSGKRFSRGDDYTIDYSTGSITTQADGDMTDGTEYAIDYDFKPKGSFEKSGVADPITKVRDLPRVTTDRGCELAAESLVDQLEEPQYEAEVQIASNPQSWSVVESLNIEEVPTGVPLQLKQIKFAPSGAQYSLANRKTISKVLEDVRDDLAVVSRRV